MSDRKTKYFLVQDRKKPKKTRQYRYDDDDDDDDDDSEIYPRIVRAKPPRKEQRMKYLSTDELESDYRRQDSDPKIKVRKTSNGDRVILDEDDNIIKVIRNERTPSPPPVEHRRLRHRPRESETVFYETNNGHLVSRPLKKNPIQTKKTQVIYADDEPVKVIKRVVIDPRTGDRETYYDKDMPRKQQRYYTRQHPAEILIDSDDDYEQHQQPQYVRVIKHRTIPPESFPRREPSPKYIMIKRKPNSEPIYGSTSKMPIIRNNRRVIYESPARKPLTTYVYPSNGKYY